MTPVQAISFGASRVSQSKRIWGLVWLLHILVATALASFPAAFVAYSLAHSNWSQELLGQLDVSWVFEAVKAERGMPYSAIMSAAAAMAALLLPLNTFIAGGAIAHFLDREFPYSPRRFYENCGRYFWRFFRLFLISLIFYGLALALSGLINRIADKIWGKGMEAAPLVWMGRLQTVVMVLLVLFVHLLFDYAKIILVWEDRRSAWRSMAEAWKFTLHNKSRTFGLLILLLLLSLVLGLVWWGFRAATEHAPAGLLVVIVMAQQCYVLARIGMRLLGWASQAGLAQSLRPEYKPVVKPVFTPEPAADYSI